MLCPPQAQVLPTGGYFAIWMSLQRCTQVAVYGFHFEPGFGIKHHYFNSEKPLKVCMPLGRPEA